MSGTTPRMGLKTWDGSDPFLRSDFDDNSRKIDSFANQLICTSTTRPSWGAAQAGMKIIESDTRRELMWSGTSWREPLNTPPVFVASITPLAQLYQGTTLNFSMSTVTLNRPGTLVVWLAAEIAASPWTVIGSVTSPTVDGNVIGLSGDGGSRHVWSPSANNLTLYRNYASVPAMGAVNLVAGSHTFGIQLFCTPYGNNGSGGMTLQTVRAMAMIVNSQDT